MVTIDQIKSCFEKHKVDDLEFQGYCNRCGTPTVVEVSKYKTENGPDDIKISGGALIEHPEFDHSCIKMTCDRCFAKTEVYSRVVGYMRPVNAWNDGKLAEWKLRKTFDKGLAA